MKIISFNVGTTHLMHFNQRKVYPTGETTQNKIKRAKAKKTSRKTYFVSKSKFK